jgi:hypothetical protein
MESLKPCPFCGSPGEAWSDIVNGDTKWFVGCPGLDCPVETAHTVQHTTRKDAIRTWNTRAPIAQQDVVCEHCNKPDFNGPVQFELGWKHCPHCGRKLTELK